MKIMEFQKKYLLWRIDFSEPLRIPDFRVLETGGTGETHAIEYTQNMNFQIFIGNRLKDEISSYYFLLYMFLLFFIKLWIMILPYQIGK